jgi:hypothetical protein
MNEHTAFLRLAATAVDFPLEAADARALAQHIDGCDRCRRAADAFRLDATALRSLPRRSPSPHVAAAIARAARGETRTGRPPLLMLSLGFLLVAGVAGAIIGASALRQVLLDRQPPPNIAPSAAPTAGIVLPSPSGPSPSTNLRLGVEWQIVDSASDGGSSATAAWAVTAGGPGFVAVGRTCQGETCWGGPQLSVDGLTWELVPRQPALEIGAYYPTSGPGADMIGVAARADAIVAIGYAVDGAMTIDAGGVFRAAVWVSPDGRTWERAADGGIFQGARFSDVAATEQGFVIVGAVYDRLAPQGRPPRGAIWTSADGRAWQRVPDGPIFDIGGYLDTGEDPGSGGPRRVISADGAFVAAGAVCNDKGLDCRPAFWSSADGSTWERAVVEEPNTNARDIAVTAGGYVAVGSASNPGGCGVGLPCSAIVFTSTDGRTWERHDVNVPDGLIVPDALRDAVAVGGRIIAIADEVEPDGQERIDGPFWSSTDGLTWTLIEGIPQDFGPSPYQPLAASPDRVVIVGDLNGRIAVSPKG